MVPLTEEMCTDVIVESSRRRGQTVHCLVQLPVDRVVGSDDGGKSDVDFLGLSGYRKAPYTSMDATWRRRRLASAIRIFNDLSLAVGANTLATDLRARLPSTHRRALYFIGWQAVSRFSFNTTLTGRI